jgi:methylated-DNA-protein-cysteine methyltransferase-like protein
MTKLRYIDIHEIVSQIPRGRVATYGQIAELAGMPGQARRVGYALSALPEGSRVPWQRVLNAKGEISLRSHSSAENLQRKLLRSEGVLFDKNGRVLLDRFQWRPKSWAPSALGGERPRAARRRVPRLPVGTRRLSALRRRAEGER